VTVIPERLDGCRGLWEDGSPDFESRSRWEAPVCASCHDNPASCLLFSAKMDMLRHDQDAFVARRIVDQLDKSTRRKLLTMTVWCPATEGHSCSLLRVYRIVAPDRSSARYIGVGSTGFGKDSTGILNWTQLGERRSHRPSFFVYCRHGEVYLPHDWLARHLDEAVDLKTQKGKSANLSIEGTQWFPRSG
jgi:hypothetical protein